MNNQTENQLPEKLLVEKIIQGDSRAFSMVIRQTERLVTQIVTQLITDPEDRKDIAQDIYLKAFGKLPGFRFQSKLSTWIAQIGYNTCLDYLRKQSRKPGVTVLFPESDDHEEELAEASLSASPMAAKMEDLLVRKQVSGLLQSAMEKLPPLYKTLVVLFHQEELSYEEIGNITGLPAGTLKSYLFRARKQLKEILLANYKKEDLW